MKISRSIVISTVAILGLILWFFFNTVLKKPSEKPKSNTPEVTETVILPTVVYQDSTATEHRNSFQLYGRTEPNREVIVKAETPGKVVSAPAKEGATVRRGTLLCRQDVDARQANLDQANANLAAKVFDLESTQTLVDKGFKSQIQLNSLQAAVDGARAGVKQAEIELGNVNMYAPFSGVFDKRLAEIGDYLSPGQPCGMVVEMSPLVVTTEFTESQVGLVEIGQEVDVALATGESLSGTVRFIESRANAATRTFRSEIVVPNKDLKLKAGVTATVKLRAGKALAHLIPSGILSLGNDGQVGVRYLNYDNKVEFARVTTIDEDVNGIWVTGLPDTVRLIIKGQDFVEVGVEVDPRLPESEF